VSVSGGTTRPEESATHLSTTVAKNFTPADDDAAVAGALIGRYLVLDRLGSGGMGTVYRAYDPELHREVALKQIRSDALDDQAGARLIREARAMARLAHPNVVAVHDVVVDDGRVSLAMELVDGGTLSQWLDTPREPDEIVATLVAAGRGLAAAHDAGLVHRDFKPSNVLVANDGTVKVTDFGLVKSFGGGGAPVSGRASGPDFLFDADLTAHSGVLGTPRYMAPEQGAGNAADPASDQYGFCVALWTALAGHPPFEGADFRELQTAKLQGPPTLPRDVLINASVRKAIARGMSVKPSDRWPDMPALLEVLERRPPRRWSWLVGVAFVIGIPAAIAALREEPVRCDEAAATLDTVWSENVRTRLSETFEASRAPYAAEAWQRVDAELSGYGQRWRELRRDACVSTHIDKSQSTAEMDLQVGCLQEARASLAAVVEVLRSGDDDVLARGHALVRQLPEIERCGDTLELRRSAERTVSVSDEDPAETRRIRKELARATALNAAGRYAEAIRVAAPLYEASEALSMHPLGARIAMVYGAALCETGAVDDGISVFTEAHRRALASDDDELAARVALKLAFYLSGDAKRPNEALWLVEFADATSMHLEHAADIRARVLSVRSQVYRGLGRWDEALDFAQRALELRIADLGPEHPDVAVSHNNLGLLLYDLDRSADGVEHLEQASRIWRAQLGESHPEVATARNNLAMVLERTGRLDEAEQEYRAALRIRESVFGVDHPTCIAVRHNLGLIMLSRGEPAAAEKLIGEALEQWKSQASPSDRVLAIAHNSLGLALRDQGRTPEAIAAFEAAIDEAEASFGPDHPQVCQFRNNLGQLLTDSDPKRARALAQRSIAVCEAKLGAEHRSVRSAYEILETLP
jgi:tetratricopeptide (TPR) repeat protein